LNGDDLIYQNSKKGYLVHLFTSQEKPPASSTEVKPSDETPSARKKGLFEQFLDLIQRIFHKCVIFLKKRAQKIFNIKCHLPQQPWVEELKKRWMQKNGEFLIYRPDNPLKCCVHLLTEKKDPKQKDITFKLQANVEQESFLAI
jgi:hypothetical protein